MDLNLTWGQVAEATRGTLLRGRESAPFARLSTDSRRVGRRDAFWALRGDRHDAHAFLNAELARACGGWVVRGGAALPADLPDNVLSVDDTRGALARLARYHRDRFDIPVVGVTGTNGKTTVKEMLKRILSVRGPVCATEGNFNNEIGLPLSVLQLTPAHRFAVFEMGASRAGDIRYLCEAARPTAGVLTNIGPAHLEFFGDIETVFRTKSELAESLPQSAPVALNADDPMLRRLLPRLGSRAVAFGTGKDARVRVKSEAPPGRLGPRGMLELDCDGRLVEVKGEFGAMHRINAAAAAAGALALGFEPGEIQAGLSAFRPSPLRFETRTHPSGAVLVIDAYNANPASMRAGISSFLELNPNGRRLLILGDMAELGKDAARLHSELGDWLGGLKLDALYLAGPLMASAREALARSGKFRTIYAAGAEALLPEIRKELSSGTALYFKASRAMGLEKLAEAL